MNKNIGNKMYNLFKFYQRNAYMICIQDLFNVISNKINNNNDLLF